MFDKTDFYLLKISTILLFYYTIVLELILQNRFFIEINIFT